MSLAKQMQNAGSLLSAVDALRNWRALSTLLGTFVATSLAFGLAATLSMAVHPMVGGAFFLLGWAVIFYGMNACGILLMDEAKGQPSRSIADALLCSLTTAHRLLLVLLLSVLIYIATLLLLALLLVICKIPVLGPLLFTLVFPVGVVTVGLTLFAMFFVVLPLAAPAVWDGASTMDALSRLVAIARKRLVNVLLMVLLLFLIAAVIGGLIGMVMLLGTLVTGGMAASIVGIGGVDWSRLPSIFGSADQGHVIAAAIGGGVVWAIALVLPALVYVKGCCQIYLDNVSQVDVAGTQEALQEKFELAKRKAQQMRADMTAPREAAETAATAIQPVVAPVFVPVPFPVAVPTSTDASADLSPYTNINSTAATAAPAVSTAAMAPAVAVLPKTEVVAKLTDVNPPRDISITVPEPKSEPTEFSREMPGIDLLPDAPASPPSVMPVPVPVSVANNVTDSKASLPAPASEQLPAQAQAQAPVKVKEQEPELQCPGCRAPYTPGDKFCDACGKPLSGPATA